MLAKTEISNAEWEVMRLLWTLKSATSRQLSEQLAAKFQWKSATVKTLLRRLDEKNFVVSQKTGRSYVYFPNIDEQETLDAQLMDAVGRICQMHVGRTLATVIRKVPLTKNDIQRLQSVLDSKLKDAPVKLECNCLSCTKDCEALSCRDK